MPSVDNRVVSMQFNNSSFEQKVGTTISSLSKLKDSLNFSKSTQNLKDLNAAGNNVKLDGMASALDNISSKFSAMGVIAATVISNITTKALQMASTIAQQFTLGPIKEGFAEYETNLNSIQTILSNTASKGTTLDQVNEALRQLNVYSDQTIYNFGEMARNIGTFTAAGVDLDTSVNAIKGIANLAAMSGSNSNQAATAMYQLSQALAAGTLKLMDWNSVVNAGMGGEVFKSALFETAKAMGTLSDVPIDQSFQEWEDAGNNFRETLQDGWVTAEVLTTTLSGFTGDLNEETLLSIGYTQEQADQIMKTAKIAVSAATEVKSFTQLLGTVKEAIGTGWADTFSIVIGNFTEAKELFTGINNAIGDVINKSSEARNKVLEGWKAFGGRNVLIDALKDGLSALNNILTSLKYAFKDVFPPVTVATLLDLTKRFSDFIASIKPSPELLTKLTQIFRGIFSVFSIGFEIVKNIASVFKDLFKVLGAAIGPGIIDFFADLGNKIFKLQQDLVAGGGIAEWFDKLRWKIVEFIVEIKNSGAVEFLTKIKDAITDFISSLRDSGAETAADGVSNAVDRVGERFGWLSVVAEKLSQAWQGVVGFFSNIADGLYNAFEKIQEVLGEGAASLGDGVANAMGEADFSNVFDVLNTGLFAVIALAFRNFVKNGLKLDFGDGMLENISKSFEALTGTLTAMQQNIKADTLMKIAISMGVLTASLLVLSLIDSAALTKALIALGVAFGELAGMLAALNLITGDLKSTASIIGMAGALILLASAILILSFAVKILSTMNWTELAQGLTGVGALLAALTLAINNMPDKGEMFKAGLAMIGMAIAIGILSLAVRFMATMSLQELMTGLLGVGVALLLLVGAVNTMPKEGELIKAGVAMMFMAGAVGLLALAVKAFSMMELDQMVQGLIGVGVALGLMVLAFNLMPNEAQLLAIGVSLLMVSVGLLAISAAIAILGNMEMSSLIQGIVAIGVVLLALGVAMAFMQANLLGAQTLLMVAGGLLVLAFAIGMFSAVDWMDIVKALAAIAGVIAILAIASLLLAPTIPVMLALGAALALLGVGLFLVGGAVMLAGLGIMFLAQGFAQLISVMAGNAEVVVQFFDLIIMKIPELMRALAEGLLQSAQMFIAALPGLIAGLQVAIEAFFQLIIDSLPKFFEMVGNIITGLINLLREKVPEFITLGFELLLALLQGISDNIGQITDTVAQIIINFLNALSARINEIIDAGMNLLINFLTGIGNNIARVYEAVGWIISEMLRGIGDAAGDIVRAGADTLIKFLEGVGNEIYRVVDAGFDIITKLMEGVANRAVEFADDCFTLLTNFLNALSTVIEDRSGELRDAGLRLVGAVIDGITGGVFGRMDEIVQPFKDFATNALDAVKGIFGISSPAKEMIKMMGFVAAGVVIGLNKDKTASKAANRFGTDLMLKMNDAMAKAAATVATMDEFNPTIAPVLDLTNVEKDVSKMNSLISAPRIEAGFSFGRASDISLANANEEDSSASSRPAVQEIKFEQTINSPKALSTSDIYRNTKTQIAMAKEELRVS